MKNTGTMAVDEVVQLYVSLPYSKLQKPIRSLQRFKRIYLQVGETKTVIFTLQPAQFAARDNQNVAVVEPGKVVLSVGGQQPDLQSIAVKKVAQQSVEVKGEKYFVN